MAALLPWHVQNFVMIWLAEYDLQQMLLFRILNMNKESLV